MSQKKGRRKKKTNRNFATRTNNAELKIVSTSNPLQEYGIEYELVKVNPDELVRQGYTKLPSETLSNVSSIFQFIPGIVANQATLTASEINTKKMLEGAYKVIVKDGMHLAKSKATEGAFRGTLLSNATNQVSGQAEFFKIIPVELSKVPQYALGIFSILSAVTGQFYLSEIHNRLFRLETQVTNIQLYLSDEKKSKLWADEQILNQIFENLRYINKNNIEIQASLSEVKAIKREALGNIRFFNGQIMRIRKNLSAKSKKEFIEKAVQDIGDYLPQYWCAVNIYSKAQFLEVLISEMDDPEYLENVQADLVKYRDEYLIEYNACKQAFFELLDEAKALNWAGTVPLALTTAASALIPNNAVKIVVATAGTVATGINEHVKTKTKENIEKDVRNFLNICSDVTPIDAVRKSVNDYSLIRNSTIELVQTSDSAYVRYTLPEEDSNRYELLVNFLQILKENIIDEHEVDEK